MSDNTNSAQERTASIDLAQLDKLGGAIKMVVNMLTRDNTPIRIEAAGALIAAYGELAELARHSLTSGTPAEPAVVPCEDCDGRGHDGDFQWQGHFQPPEPGICNSCGGSGKWLVSESAGAAAKSEQAPTMESTGDEQFDAGTFLLNAAQDFWDACHNAGQYGAVQWLEGDDGNLLIYTRGEYRDQLMNNIHKFASQPVRHFPATAAGAGSDPAGGRESGCRMTGGICACRSGGSFGGCARERSYCCTNEPSKANPTNATVQGEQIGAGSAQPRAEWDEREPECGMCNDSGIVGYAPDQYEDCPECIKARAALARAPLPAQAANPVAMRDALRRSGANTDYHGLIAFTQAQFGDFVSMLTGSGVQPVDDARDAARYRALRDLMQSAKGSASIEVNQHLAYYEKCEPGEEVKLQWYPDTPIGFYTIQGGTLDQVADEAAMRANDGAAEGGKPCA